MLASSGRNNVTGSVYDCWWLVHRRHEGTGNTSWCQPKIQGRRLPVILAGSHTDTATSISENEMTIIENEFYGPGRAIIQNVAAGMNLGTKSSSTNKGCPLISRNDRTAAIVANLCRSAAVSSLAE